MKLGFRWWVLVLLIVLSVGIGSMYLSAAFSAAPEHVIAPVDDAYITFQYARQIARGYPYQYNDGDPPTTGMSSPLFGFLLAGVYLLGFTGERLVAFSIGAGPVWLGLIAWLTYRLVRRLTGDATGQVWPWLAAVLAVLTGTIQWGCFNGMETGLFTVFTLAALDAFLARHVDWSALWLGLAGLTRPGGLVLAVSVWIATLVGDLLQSGSIRYRRLAILGGAIGVDLVPLLVNWALVGTTASSGLRAKSWWYNVPYYPWEFIRSTLHSYREIMFTRFLGWTFPEDWFMMPGLLLLTGLGWVILGRQRQWRALLVTLLWFFAGTLSTATLITATWHLGRYQVPVVPIAIALAVSGLAFLQLKATRRWQYVLPNLIALFLVITSVCLIPRFTASYRAAVDTLAQQHLQVVKWLNENTPIDTRIGILDAGMLRYLGKRPTYDLAGLTTPHAAIPWRHGAGSVFERMEHSPRRPDYFVVFPDIFSVPYLTHTGLFAEEVFRVKVPDLGISSPSHVQEIWRADWSLAGSGDRFYQPDVLMRTKGLTLVDTLDIADLEDETASNVVWWQDEYRTGFPTELQQFAYHVLPERQVLDGGRLLTGGISFDVNAIPGEPLWIVSRLHARESGAVRVEVDRQDVGRWLYPLVPGEWLETVFFVPAEAITSSSIHVTLRVDATNPDFRHYAPYYFWLLQGEPEAKPDAEHHVDVVFDEALRLVGFDLTEKTWQPGDTLQTTLYWQAQSPNESDAKVFLHLRDASGNLLTQADGWAFHNTRPPYSWGTDEAVADPRSLILPADLSAGQYSLEVGLYNPDESGRLPAYRDGIRQHEDSVLLATIEVTE